MRKLWSVCAVLAALSLTAGPTSAQSITFETTPAGIAPVDDAALPMGTPYTFPGLSINFGFDSDSNGTVDTDAVFEQVAGPQSEPNIGFVGSNGFDIPDAGYFGQLGTWFLRSSTSGSNFGKLVIKYTTALTVTSASGEIWDIDGEPPDTEQYRVQAFDSSNVLLGTIDSPVGTLPTLTAPLDGQPWQFVFSGLSGSIDHIEISFTGTKTGGIGLAFNNFYPTTVPEPGMGALLLGAWPLISRRVRLRRSGRGGALR